MTFEQAVASICTKHALKRVASAHVVDYSHLGEQELRANILRTKNQYTHPDSVKAALETALYLDSDLDHRLVSELVLVEVLVNEYGHLLPMAELEEKVLQREQDILNESNEKELKDLAGGREDSEQYRNLFLYNFVLQTAWSHRDTKSVDEANLLRKLRDKLVITAREHHVLEAKIGKYPKSHNELHTKGDVQDVVRELEQLGLVFTVRNEDGVDFVVVPEEIAGPIKDALKIEMRLPGYVELLQYKAVRSRAFLETALGKDGIPYSTRLTLKGLQERVAETIAPSILLGGHSPKDGLSNEDLYAWCSDLGLPVAGRKDDRIKRIIEHYDQLHVTETELGDPREQWYEYFIELAGRDLQKLRGQHVVEKDNEVDKCFEEATAYLFENKLNHTPLHQTGTEHCDGKVSFRDTYIMWDNKSSGMPVHLKDHIRQFDAYMEQSDKPVPVFLVIAPAFTAESAVLALEYTSQHIGRNIALVQADELKELAELWSSEDNKRNSEPFPLGLFARPGRFDLSCVRSSLK